MAVLAMRQPAGMRLREVRIVELNRVGVPYGMSCQANLARQI